MGADWNVLQPALVLFFATLVRSAFGFGEALIAVPLLALVMPVKEAAPAAVLVSITIALIVVIQDWQRVHARSAGWLVLSTVAGIPAGLLLLKSVAEPLVKAILGVIIAAFAVYSLRKRHSYELADDRHAWFFGLTAGILGGAYGMNGPPLAIYGSLRRWTPENFRATLQAYFLPASVLGMGGYWLAGMWTPAVNRIYLFSLPGVLAAIFLGRMINRRLLTNQFVWFVYAGLAVIGGILAFEALAGLMMAHA
jgi:uncharacterized membrane protein YfcA